MLSVWAAAVIKFGRQCRTALWSMRYDIETDLWRLHQRLWSVWCRRTTIDDLASWPRGPKVKGPRASRGDGCERRFSLPLRVRLWRRHQCSDALWNTVLASSNDPPEHATVGLVLSCVNLYFPCDVNAFSSSLFLLSYTRWNHSTKCFTHHNNVKIVHLFFVIFTRIE